jgi:hypothetical protein
VISQVTGVRRPKTAFMVPKRGADNKEIQIWKLFRDQKQKLRTDRLLKLVMQEKSALLRHDILPYNTTILLLVFDNLSE